MSSTIIPGAELEYRGEIWEVMYHDADSFDTLPSDIISQVYGVCFWGHQMLIGLGRRDRWALLGGSPESGETWQNTLEREIREEANMRVVSSSPLGYQDLTNTSGVRQVQLRAFAFVEPIGPFVADPAGGIKQIKLIDPFTWREYFDWGTIGEHLVNRGISLAISH